MEVERAVEYMAALAQETRLRAFRLLVQAGHDGLSPGTLSEALGVPQNTLSFHLAHLAGAGLVRLRKEGRSRVYTAEFSRVRELIRYLVEHCCSVDFVECAPGACGLPDQVTLKDQSA